MLILAALLMALPGALIAQETGIAKLDDASKALFWGSPEDPPTPELHGVDEEHEGRHYLHGDEYNMWVFHPYIQDVGGGYIGVGTDQAYLFMGWQKPELAWLIDYDEWVVALHKAYFSFFKAAETPEDFKRYWSKEGEKDALALIEKDWKDHPDYDLVRKLYDDNRRAVDRRLAHLTTQMNEKSIPTFLTDADQYAFVRDMVREGRVRSMLTNLLDDEGMVGIGKVSHELGVPIRILYLSNAEQYWKYSDQFRTNIRAMHHDDTSLIIRTLGSFTQNKDYRYYVQPYSNFLGWLKLGWAYKIHRIVDRPKLSGPEDIPITFFDKDPVKADKKRAARKKK